MMFKVGNCVRRIDDQDQGCVGTVAVPYDDNGGATPGMVWIRDHADNMGQWWSANIRLIRDPIDIICLLIDCDRCRGALSQNLQGGISN